MIPSHHIDAINRMESIVIRVGLAVVFTIGMYTVQFLQVCWAETKSE